MVIETERLKIRIASDDEMRRILITKSLKEFLKNAVLFRQGQWAKKDRGFIKNEYIGDYLFRKEAYFERII